MKDLPNHFIGCTGKIPYFTLREANDVKRKMKERKVRLYKCKFMEYGQEHWHITSMPKRTVRKIFIKKKKYLKSQRNQFRHSMIS